MMLARGWVLAVAACASAAPAQPTTVAPNQSAAPAKPAVAAGPSVAAATPAATPAAAKRKTNDTLVGVVDQPAPPWQVSQWFNSQPLSLDQLRGKVVFVRWFMGPSCPFCSGTAPTLRALHERYGAKGLAVVGMYHHKEKTPLDPEQVEGWIKHYGYQFPIAIDKDWTTLRKWWLDAHDRSFTSVSFLIDKAGVVRRVHLGGLIKPEGDDIAAINSDVERLIAE
jgi:thiol-disulfide isomerase/thioredoxin